MEKQSEKMQEAMEISLMELIIQLINFLNDIAGADIRIQGEHNEVRENINIILRVNNRDI